MDNSESQIEKVEVLYFDDLPESDREWAEDMGCEPGKAYFESFDPINEVPVCPFCHIAVWPLMNPGPASGCKHLMFIYDLNAEFTYVNKMFAHFFWENFLSQLEEFYEDQEILKMQNEGILPISDEILECVPDLKLYSLHTYWGTGGVECGFASDEFLTEYSITPERNAKKNR